MTISKRKQKPVKSIERPPADAVSAAKISEPGIYEVWVPSDFTKEVMAKKVTDFKKPEEAKEAKKPLLAQQEGWDALWNDINEELRTDPPFRGEFVPDYYLKNEKLVKARFFALIETAYNSGRKDMLKELEK